VNDKQVVDLTTIPDGVLKYCPRASDLGNNRHRAELSDLIWLARALLDSAPLPAEFPPPLSIIGFRDFSMRSLAANSTRVREVWCRASGSCRV
jgi:hypothetical protein